MSLNMNFLREEYYEEQYKWAELEEAKDSFSVAC